MGAAVGQPELVQRLRELVHGLRELVDGLRELVDGLRELVNGLRELVNGLSEPVDGLRELVHGLSDPVHGPREPVHGLRRPVGGLREPVDGMSEPVHGLGELVERPGSPLTDTWKVRRRLVESVPRCTRRPRVPGGAEGNDLKALAPFQLLDPRWTVTLGGASARTFTQSSSPVTRNSRRPTFITRTPGRASSSASQPP